MIKLRTYSPPDHLPDRLAANWMLMAAALALGLHFDRLPLWVSFGSLALLAWRFLIENRGWRVPGRWVRWALACLVLVVIIKEHSTVFGRDAGMDLLSALVGLKLLEIRRLRDYFVAVYLLYLLTLGAFLYSQSIAMGAWSALVVLVITHALVLLNRPWPMTGRQAHSLVMVMFLQALPLMLVSYLLFPRVQGSLWGLPMDAVAARTGLSETLTAGAFGHLLDNDDIAFRVTFDGPLPPPRDRYWRGFVLSDVDGRSWVRSERRWPGRGEAPIPEPQSAWRYTISLEAHHKYWLPSLELPTEAPNRARRILGNSIESLVPVRRRLRYSMTSYTDYITGPLSRRNHRDNLVLPDRISERVRALVETWSGAAISPHDVVRTALAFFRQEEFHYSLSPPVLKDDPVDEFLFETRSGYCEHYAAAFVTLMRLAGIPARIVVGFQGGEWNDVGNYLIVRESDAHAWSEVWLADRGWTRVDPTAAVAPERIELGFSTLRLMEEQNIPLGSLDPNAARRLIGGNWLQSRLRNLRLTWDSVNNAWNNWVMAYGPENQAALMRLMGFDIPSWTKLVLTLATAVGLIGLILVAWTLRPQRRDPLLSQWEAFCRKMGNIGTPRAAHEGPADYANRLTTRHPQLRPSIESIVELYVGMRYGRLERRQLSELRRRISEI